VKDRFAIKIPSNIDLQYAAPLLCAGITTYSPLMRTNFKKGDKVGVAGIGGLGHLAIKLAVSKGGVPETQEVMNYCAANKIYPQIQIIKAANILPVHHFNINQWSI
jgi:D-arabinose 1-dehydrogenase-like Zn-dependent alcohol dehydrogenase